MGQLPVCPHAGPEERRDEVNSVVTGDTDKPCGSLWLGEEGGQENAKSRGSGWEGASCTLEVGRRKLRPKGMKPTTSWGKQTQSRNQTTSSRVWEPCVPRWAVWDLSPYQDHQWYLINSHVDGISSRFLCFSKLVSCLWSVYYWAAWHPASPQVFSLWPCSHPHGPEATSGCAVCQLPGCPPACLCEHVEEAGGIVFFNFFYCAV